MCVVFLAQQPAVTMATMTHRSILVTIILCNLVATTQCVIDTSTILNVETFRQHSLYEIIESVLIQYPDELRHAMLQMADSSDAVNDMVKQLTDSIDTFEDTSRCTNCTKIFTNFAIACKQNDTYNAAVQLVIGLCHVLIRIVNEIQSGVDIKADPLCDGTVYLQAPHIRVVLNAASQNPATAAEEFCTNMNACIPPATATMTSQWVTSTDDKHGQASSVVADSDIITVVQLTDIHVEPQYAIGSPTDCGLPVCCLSKWEGSGTGSARPSAEYTCNIPQRTIDLFLAKVNAMNPNVILFSGDIPPHTIWDETEESQTNCTVLLTDSIRRMLPNRTVYPCIGNHETYPTNLYSHQYLSSTPRFATNFYELWKSIAGFTDEQNATIAAGAYYTMLIRPGLRLLAINSNYMYSFNWYNVLNIDNGEMTRMQDFMAATLAGARNSSEKVILLGHHPIGGADIIVTESRWYQSLLLQYSDIVVLQPTGHTHVDEMRLIYNSSGDPVSVVLVSPSLSSGGTKNPSMRVYKLNSQTFEVVDYEQWFLDLSPVARRQQDAQQEPETNADITDSIQLLYTAKSAYGLSDLSPQSWHDLTESFKSDSDALRRHLEYSDASASQRYVCLAECQQRYICRQQNADYDKYLVCINTALNTTTTTSTRTTPSHADGNSTASIDVGLGTSLHASFSIINITLLCIAAYAIMLFQ